MNSSMNTATPTTTALEPRSQALVDPLPVVRQTVRALLLASPAFLELAPECQRQMAETMVKVCYASANLMREEIESANEAQHNGAQHAEARAPTPSNNGLAHIARQPLAHAQEFDSAAVDRVARTTRDVIDAVSFPRFVTELINGVFKAIGDSNQQQMQSFVELLNNVAASTEGFADLNFGPNRARAWLAERYPASFELAGAEEEEGEREPGEPPPERPLRLLPGAAMPSAEALKVDLGFGPDETVPTGDPDRTLVPLARRALARQRQQMLSTMVMMGLQRIVIESGRITASMRFHIDARSAAQDDRASRLNIENQLEAEGKFGIGAWGMSAKMTNTIGYVSTQQTQTTQDLRAEVDVNSSVELNFKTDYLPLDRLSGSDRVAMIKANSLNPQEEARIAAQARTDRARLSNEGDAARRANLNAALNPPATTAPTSPTPTSRTPASPAPASPAPASPAPASPAPASPTPASPTPASPTPASPTPASPTPASPTPPARTTAPVPR